MPSDNLVINTVTIVFSNTKSTHKTKFTFHHVASSRVIFSHISKITNFLTLSLTTYSNTFLYFIYKSHITKKVLISAKQQHKINVYGMDMWENFSGDLQMLVCVIKL